MIESRRGGFAMLLALAVIIILAVISSLVMNVSAKTVNETTTQYQREQAALLARSYTEYAILAATANDRAVDCIENIVANVGPNPTRGQGYNVRINIAYIAQNGLIGTCPASRSLYGRVPTENIATGRAQLNILVDAYVRYKDLDDPRVIGINNFANVPWKIYHRRTLQKI